MWFGVSLAVVGSWFFLCATRRSESTLAGWPGTYGGIAVAALAVWQVHGAGLGLAVAIAVVLAAAILALPCLSYWQALRRRAAKAGR